DERPTGVDLPLPLRRLDQVQTQPVLDRAAGILILELEEQLARTGVQMAHGDERGVADHLQHVVADLRWHSNPQDSGHEARLLLADPERCPVRTPPGGLQPGPLPPRALTMRPDCTQA